jgi:dethiobiotin synthetase
LAKTYFITATDTEVGKTFIAAGLAKAAQNRGLEVGYYKPISCGGIEDAEFLKYKLKLKDSLDLMNPIRFKQPLSPYAACIKEHVRVDLEQITTIADRLNVIKDFVLIEGLGGVLAPIKKDYFVVDMICSLRSPTIIVARAGLGTINHTLMTVEILKKRKLNIAGIIMNGYTGRELSEKTNDKVIEELSGIPVIGRIKAKSTFNSLLKQIEKQKILNKLL